MQIQKTIQTVSNRLVYFMIICVGIVLFGKSIFYAYTYADDTTLLVANQPFIGNIANLPKLFTTDVFISVTNPQIYYRPLLNLTFMLEAQIAKDNPLLYHITNILLHIGCSILVFILFQQLMFPKILSALSAVVFCVHPLQTSAVVWIPGRNDSLLTLFILSSFLFFLRSQETKRIGAYLAHVILFFLAFLVKETAIVLPFICIGYVSIVKREKLQRGSLISLVTAYIVVMAFWLVLRSMVHRSFDAQESVSTFIADCFSNLPSYILYIGKVFVPINLSVFPNLADHSLVPGIFSILFFTGLIIVFRPASLRMVAWGFLWFFLFLAPSLAGDPTFYEHRAYCSIIGLLIAVASLPMVAHMDFSRTANAAVVAILLLVFSLITFFHEDVYRNRESFTFQAYATAPSSDNSSYCMASMYLDKGDDTAAEEVILAEIKRKPAMAFAHRMLGGIYHNRHEYDLASQEYELAIRIEPHNHVTYFDYGKMNIEMGRIDAAVQSWKTAVQINPDFLFGYYYLANCYLHAKNDPDSAMVYVKELEQRGETVMPELLNAIKTHPLYRTRR